MSFCIFKSIEAMSGEETEVTDPTFGLITRNDVSGDQEKAIENVKKILSPYWKL